MRDRPNDQHRRTAERKLGRPLRPDEVSHHVDEDKSNNTDANIAVETRGEHTRQHNRNRKLSKLRAALRMTKEKRKLY